MGNVFDSLTDEKFEAAYDPTYSGAPVAEGDYEAELAFAKTDVPYDSLDQWGNFGNNPTHYGTKLFATLTGPNGLAGRRVYNYFSTAPYMSAGKGSDKKTSSAAKLVRTLAGKDAVADADTVAKLVQAFVTIIGMGKRALVRVQWNTGPCRSCKDRGVRWTKDNPTGLRGMENFPKDADGNYLGETRCPQCQGELRAQAEFQVLASI